MPNTPTYILYHGRSTGKDKEGKKIWTRIGAVWPNKSGKGFNLTWDYRWCPSIACMKYVQHAHACCYPPEARDTIHLKSAPSVPVGRGWWPAIRVSKRRNSLTRRAP
jgi:hypothetical protein